MDPVVATVILRAQDILLRRIRASYQAMAQLAMVGQELPDLPPGRAAGSLRVTLVQLDEVDRLPRELRGMLMELEEMAAGR